MPTLPVCCFDVAAQLCFEFRFQGCATSTAEVVGCGSANFPTRTCRCHMVLTRKYCSLNSARSVLCVSLPSYTPA